MSLSDLGATVLKAVVERAGVDPAEVSETILGQVLTAAQGQNPTDAQLVQRVQAIRYALLAQVHSWQVGDGRDMQGVLNVIQAGICDGDRLGTRFDVR